MTIKHFEAVARIFRNYAGLTARRTQNDVAKSIAQDVADYFAAENPNFDRERFLTACGF